jgi:hypothetical protein
VLPSRLGAISGPGGHEVPKVSIRDAATVNAARSKSGRPDFRDVLARQKVAPTSHAGSRVPAARAVAGAAASVSSSSATSAVSATTRAGGTVSGGTLSGLNGLTSIALSTPAGASTADQRLVDGAIAAQARAQALAGGGANPFVQGPAGYGRGAALDYAAQLQNVIANGAYLPNASGPGLTVLPGTPRYAAPQSTVDDYTRLVSQLTAQWGFSPDELAAAGQRLTANLDAGISLDPGTSAARAMDDAAATMNAARLAAAQIEPSGTSSAVLAVPTADAAASKIAALRALIAHNTQRLQVQQAKGNDITAAGLRASLAAQRNQLAALLG